MKANFLGFYKQEVSKWSSKGIDIKIISTGIDISANMADEIIDIICDELKRATINTGYNIAKRICEEVYQDQICTADVNGGTEGKKWVIKLSNNPLEFID